ncbi:MAG: branched-chain amino acid ABC transporter permease [Acidimicrobiia bacterium]
MTVQHRVELGTSASRRFAMVGIVAFVFLALIPFFADRSLLVSLTQLMILIALGELWNLLAGYAGIYSFGQQAYVGIGAYATFALADLVGLNLWLALVLSGAVAVLIAMLTALLIFRLHGGYFAVATWVVAETYRLIVKNNATLFPRGTPQPLRALSVLGANRFQEVYWLALVAGVGTIVGALILLRSRLGLALSAIRDDEETAAASGVDVNRVKLTVYLIVAAATGLVGGVYLLNNVSIDPDSYFSIGLTAQMVIVVVVGGLGTIEGPILGAIVYFLLDENLSELGAWWFIILGVFLIVVMIRAPKGLWGLIQDRTGLRLFPVQRRLVIEKPSVDGGVS